MADPVASVEKIVKLGLAIKSAVDTARHNEEECREIRKRVLRFSAILSQLQQAGLMDDNPAMSDALEDLEETLERALELVMECQQRHIVRRLLGAGDLAKQLRRVKDDISNKVILAMFAVNTHTTIVLLAIQQAGGHAPPRLQQVTEVVDISLNCHSINNVVSSSDLRIFTLCELEAAITAGESIGIGGSCDVYKGVLNDGNVVAIKKFRGPNHLGWANTYDQLLLASKLQHKNIVKVLGYGRHEVRSSPSKRNEVRSSLVMRLLKGKKVFEVNEVKDLEVKYIWVEEYVPNRCLYRIILTESRLDWSSVFRIIEGLAQGVHYLHEQRIVHMDLKPSNVLLDSDMNPKISDLDSSIVLDESGEIKLNYIIGTMGYMDPEYAFHGTVTTKTDVYAFGITLLETIRGLHTSEAPRDHSCIAQWSWEAWEAGQIEEVLDRSSFEGSQLIEIKRCMVIGLLCAQCDPADRPTMADVLEMLNGNEELPTPRTPPYMNSNEERPSDEWPASPSAWSDGSISPR